MKSLLTEAIETKNIPEMESLLKREKVDKSVELEVFEKAFETQDEQVVKTLLNHVNVVPFEVLGELMELNNPLLFDRAIAKVPHDEETFKRCELVLMEANEIKEIDPNDAELKEMAYYIERIQHFFGAVEIGR